MRKCNMIQMAKSGKIRMRGVKKDPPPKIKYDVQITWCNTPSEIDFVKGLLMAHAMRMKKNNKTYDLADERRFIILPKHEQYRIAIRMLKENYPVMVYGTAYSNDIETIEYLTQTADALEKAENDYQEKRKPLKAITATWR